MTDGTEICECGHSWEDHRFSEDYCPDKKTSVGIFTPQKAVKK